MFLILIVFFMVKYIILIYFVQSVHAAADGSKLIYRLLAK
jgi:hypothetical protein